MKEHQGDLFVACISILIRCRHHTAAVIAAVHRRCYPNLFEGHFLSVNGYGCINRLEVKKKSLDCNCCIVRLLFLAFQLISNLTAIAVDSKSNAVDKFSLFSLHSNGGKLFYVIINKERISCLCLSYIPCKIVTRTARIIIHVVFERETVQIIYDSVQRTVTSE